MDVSQMAWNDDVKAYDVGEAHDGMVRIIPMIYNHRLVAGGDDTGYAHGWCYPTLAAAVLAANVWDPDTEPTPVGFIKQATPGMRRIRVAA